MFSSCGAIGSCPFPDLVEHLGVKSSDVAFRERICRIHRPAAERPFVPLQDVEALRIR